MAHPAARDPLNMVAHDEALAHADALFRLAFHLSGSESDAEDLVQDTFARAFASTSSRATAGDPSRNLRAWLFQILRHAYIDRYRRARVNPVRGGFEEDDPSEALPSNREPLRDDEELELLRTVVASDIEAALMTLSVDARTVVLLDHEGLSEAELATVLGCAPGTVKSRLQRARAQLRERLRDYAR